MISRGILFGFLVIILIGGYFDFSAGNERNRLQADFRRLAQVAGDVEITDPSKVYIQVLDTGEPMSWAWRVHMPAKMNYSLSYQSGASSGNSMVDVDFIARTRYRQSKSGQLERYTSFQGSSSRSSSGTKEFDEWMIKHFNEFKVETLSPKQVEYEIGKPIVLLRVTVPESLANDPILTNSLVRRDGNTFVIDDVILTLTPQP